MKLWIAGGVGEHGRNCFEIIGSSQSFLVDCGIISHHVPDLEDEEIWNLSYVFLTHSHKDHTGALDWLYERGFHGKLYAAQETLDQLEHPYENAIALEKECPLFVQYARAGHCAGSVSYLFHAEGKSVLFTGDYSEQSSVYSCDPIRNVHADMAVIDCAYGSENIDKTKSVEQIRQAVRNGKRTLLPVPKYGRGMDLIDALSGCGVPIYADETLRRQLSDPDRFWYRNEVRADVHPINHNPGNGVILMCDAQMHRRETQEMSEACDQVILTGHVYEETYADHLLKDGKAQLIPYPVHLNAKQADNLIRRNSFGNVVLYHSEEFTVPAHLIHF